MVAVGTNLKIGQFGGLAADHQFAWPRILKWGLDRRPDWVKRSNYRFGVSPTKLSMLSSHGDSARGRIPSQLGKSACDLAVTKVAGCRAHVKCVG